MKCKTCGSDDIIAIQGTNYCLNCGNVVADAPIKQTRKLKVVTSAPQPAPSNLESELVAAAALPPQPAPLKTKSKAAKKRRRATRSSRPTAHPLRFSLGVAVLAAVVAAGASFGVLRLRVDGDSALYVAFALLVGLTVTSVLAQGALMYGMSRAEDRRPAERSQWWAVARSGFMDAVNVDLLIAIKLIAMIVAAAAFYKALPILAQQPPVIHFAAVVVGNLVLVWAFLGLYVMRRIAISAVMIGGLSAYQALRLSFKLYLRSGGHLLATGLETLLGRLLVVLALLGAGYAALAYVPNPTALQVELGSALAAALVVFLLAIVSLEWETRLWLHQYRHLATSFKPAERVRLLTGRTAKS